MAISLVGVTFTQLFYKHKIESITCSCLQRNDLMIYSQP